MAKTVACITCHERQPIVPGRRKYRCPKCKSWWEPGYDGPASNNPERSFELTVERKELRHGN